MNNRMEYISVDVKRGNAHRAPWLSEQTYVRKSDIKGVKRKKDNKNPNVCFVSFKGWASTSTKDVVFTEEDKKPELKYQKFINAGLVEDSDVIRRYCYEKEKSMRKNTPVDMNIPVQVTDFDAIEGTAMNEHPHVNGTCMIGSRMDRAYTAKEVAEGKCPDMYVKSAYSFNPTHEMREACLKALEP